VQDRSWGGWKLHVTPAVGEAAIVARARRRHGVVTTADLLHAGFGRNAITARVERGWLRRVHRGVYLVGALESALTKPAAALLATGPDAALSHRTAATLWNLLPPEPTEPIHITLLNANRRSRQGVRIHRAAKMETRTVQGLRIASPAQTLEQLLGDDYERAYNEAQILRLIPRDDRDGMTRSDAERELLALIRRAGLPAPRTNVKVRGHEVDLYWPEHRLVVEFDGWTYHSTRAAFERDRERDAALQLAGERVIRVTHRQLTRRPEALVAQFATGLAPTV
jgi:very-short-patch-repair endonuclease